MSNLVPKRSQEGAVIPSTFKKINHNQKYITMTIQIKQTVNVYKKVDLPLFFMDKEEACAFFETAQMRIFKLSGYSSITTKPTDGADLLRCLDSIEPCTEVEFMERWESMVSSLSLMPTLKLETVINCQP